MDDPRLAGVVEGRLLAGWSPQAISGRLARERPGDPAMRVSHETVYRWVYERASSGGQDLRGCLARGHARRRRRKAVEGRRQFGHREPDTVVGARETGVCTDTQAERKTRLLVATLVPSKSAQATAEAEMRVYGPLPPQARRSRTWDNGTESALHGTVDEKLGMTTYYADPHGPQQRGSNENRNGMIRRYLPKGTSSAGLAQGDVDEIAHEINSRPLKVLDWRTPLEAWDEEMEKIRRKDRDAHEPAPATCRINI